MQINIQPVEKPRETPFLEVHSIFYTIQGEGPFAGQPAVFVRLAGCNLQCPACDTDYTSKRTTMLAQDVLITVQAAHSSYVRTSDPLEDATIACKIPPQPLVVITGGEPFRQDIGKLVRLLVSKGYRVQIETNGTLYRPDLPWDSITIVCSPKAGRINPKLLPRIDAYKYVMRAGSVNPVDGLPTFALDHSAAPQVARPPAGNTRPVYLQPMDAQCGIQNEDNLKACIDSCMKYGYTLQIQIHKIINME